MPSPYRIEAVALHQVGIFEDMEIAFPPIESPEADAEKAEIHLFTGPNGCGKSTMLYALAAIFTKVAAKDVHIRSRFRGPRSFVDFRFAQQAGRYGVVRPEVAGQADTGLHANRFGQFRDHIRRADIGEYFGYGVSHETSLGMYKHPAQYDPRNALSQATFPFAAFSYSGQRTIQSAQLGAIQQIDKSPFEAALSFEGTTRPQVLVQWIANNRAQAALARQDGDDVAAAIYDRALARITELIRDICDLDLEFRLERSPLAVSARLNGDNIRFDGLPDGLKSIISWVGDLSLRLEAIPWEREGDVFAQPVILFLDEVDIHLHPKWQRRILPAIQRLLPNGQVFASTHSPFVVGSVEDAWLYTLPEPMGGPTSGVVQAVPSGAGKSYRLILEEIFGVEGEFDVETEALFEEFYRLRDEYLRAPKDPAALLASARGLAARGEEATLIVGRELRQVSRLTGREIALA